MNTHIIEKDITVFYVTAESFPEGIKAAYDKLNALLPSTEGRKFYGISRPEKSGVIVYKAAVEEIFPGEGAKYGCPTFIIPRGEYYGEKISGWMEDVTIIGRTFEKLLANPGLDWNGFCLEVYLEDGDMLCLVSKAMEKV